MTEKSLRERAVSATPVESDVVGLRCERDQEPCGIPHARQSILAHCCVAAGLGRQGIVAAGIEEDELKPLARLERVHDRAQLDGLGLHVLGGSQDRVDRNEVVLRRHLEPVTGVIHERHVGISCRGREPRDGILHQRPVEIDAEIDLEADLLERLPDVAGVIHRVTKRLEPLVRAVADNQRHSLLGLRSACRHEADRKPEQQQPDDRHHSAMT